MHCYPPFSEFHCHYNNFLVSFRGGGGALNKKSLVYFGGYFGHHLGGIVGKSCGGLQELPVSTDIHQPLSLNTDINLALYLRPTYIKVLE